MVRGLSLADEPRQSRMDPAIVALDLFVEADAQALWKNFSDANIHISDTF
jgi:hypothetical protein